MAQSLIIFRMIRLKSRITKHDLMVRNMSGAWGKISHTEVDAEAGVI